MDNDEIVKELLQIADQIKELTLDKHNNFRELSNDRQSYSDEEYDVYVAIYSEIDEKGKTKYSNEERRRKELAYRKRHNKKITELSVKIDRARDEELIIIAEINRLQDRKIIYLVALGAPLPEDTLEKEENKKYPDFDNI